MIPAGLYLVTGYADLGQGFQAVMQANGASVIWIDGQPYSANPTLVRSLAATFDPLPAAKKAKLEALAAEYAARIAAGRAYTVPGVSTNTYQIDDVSPTPGRPSSQGQIARVAQQADRAIRNGATGTPWDAAVAIPFFFQDAANNQVPMTAQEAYDFATAIGQYCTGLVLRLLEIKNQTLGAADQAALDAIDITTGWPT